MQFTEYFLICIERKAHAISLIQNGSIIYKNIHIFTYTTLVPFELVLFKCTLLCDVDKFASAVSDNNNKVESNHIVSHTNESDRHSDGLSL